MRKRLLCFDAYCFVLRVLGRETHFLEDVVRVLVLFHEEYIGKECPGLPRSQLIGFT